MFVERRIVVAGSKQNGDRLARLRRRHGIKRIAQQLRIGIDRLDRQELEQFGAEPQHRLAIFEHVGYAGRRSGIVLKNEKLVRPRTHQIDAADVRVDAVRRFRSRDRHAELGVGEDDVRRNDAVRDDFPCAVDVVDKGIDRADPLFEARGQPIPFTGGENPRKDIEGDDALCRLIVTINGECDPEAPERGFRRLLAPRQFRARRFFQPPRERFKPLTGGTRKPKPPQFVKGAGRRHPSQSGLKSCSPFPSFFGLVAHAATQQQCHRWPNSNASAARRELFTASVTQAVEARGLEIFLGSRVSTLQVGFNEEHANRRRDERQGEYEKQQPKTPSGNEPNGEPRGHE